MEGTTAGGLAARRNGAFRLVLAAVLQALCVGAQDGEAGSHAPTASARIAIPASVSALGTAFARADVALCRSVINVNHLKGDYAESVVGRFYLEQHLRASGNWQAVTPRLGRQGLDHVYLRRDAAGNPRAILVGETKFGSSRLGMTQDGKQMSQTHVAARLRGMGNRFTRIAEDQSVRVVGRPSTLGKREIPVTLSDGRRVCFWQEKSDAPWLFGSRQEDLAEARRALAKDGRFLIAAGEGRTAVRYRLFQLNFEGHDTLAVRSLDVRAMGSNGSLAGLPSKEFRIRLTGNMERLSNSALKQQISTQLKAKYPYLSPGECRDYARQIASGSRSAANALREQNRSYWAHAGGAAAATSLVAFGLGAGVELLSQAWSGEMDYGRVLGMGALSGASAGTGALAGQVFARMAVQSAVMHSAVRSMASMAGVTTSTMTNALAAGIGGGLASVLFAVGGYACGYYDSSEAGKAAACGLAGAGAGTLATAGAFALAGAFGTASTGAAIGGLSGAAATNATLAWFGGGALSAGGGGMATGGLVVLGAAGVVAIVAVAGTYYCFHLYEAGREQELQGMVLAAFAKGDSLAVGIARTIRAPRTVVLPPPVAMAW
jgi:hypothetical protein